MSTNKTTPALILLMEALNKGVVPDQSDSRRGRRMCNGYML